MSKKRQFISGSSSEDYSSDYTSESDSESELTDRKRTIKNYEEVAKYVKPKNDRDILNICYKLIDKNFSYGRYAGHDVIVENKTGYINATHLCKKFGKKFHHWMKLETSEELMIALSNEEQIPKKKLIKKYVTENPETSGTYMHSLFMFAVGSWASPTFAVQMSATANYLIKLKQITNARDKLIKEKEETIANLSKQLKENNSRIQENNSRIRAIIKNK